MCTQLLKVFTLLLKVCSLLLKVNTPQTAQWSRMFICHPWKAAALRIRVTHSLSRCNVSINALSAIVCTFCHCTSALFHCFAPLSIAPLHCTAIAIALFHCNYAPFHWNVSFDHCTVSINAHSALASSSIAIAIVALLSRIIISTNIAIYIHYPNIHYQNVARSIINTYIYALQSVDKSIQAQFSGRNWVSTLPRSLCTFTISHLSVGHFCKMSEILSFIASLLTERSLPWIKNLICQTIRNIMILSFAAIHIVTNSR